MNDEQDSLGRFLKEAREAKRLSLREVERQTGVSNAYVSQLESGKATQPSPVILHKLCTLYEASYSAGFALSGYPSPQPGSSPASNPAFQRLGSITEREAEQLSDYLAFIRSKDR